MNVQVEADLASGAAPELLVPGDVAGYLLVAQTLRRHARLLQGTGDCLSRIEVTNWRGQASTGFLHVIAMEPGRWRTAADAFTAAAVALEGFLASLTPAREQARQARTLYQQYQTLLATAGALAGVPSALPGPAPTDAVMSVQDRMRIGARYQQMTAIAAGGALRGPAVPAAPDPVATVYAADTMRRQAITLLEQARRTVDAAGSLAADALAKAMEQAPAARRLTQATIRPAAISAAGTLPLLGNTVVGGRLVYKGTKLGKRAAKAYDGFRGPQSGTGWLRTHEIDGSHTLAKHQGKTDKQLKDRLRSHPVIRASSSFTSTHDAERFTETVLAAKRPEIDAWLESGRPRAGFSLDLAQTVGRGLQRGEAIRDMTQVRVVLVADGRYQDGYRVFTSYPTGP